MVALVWLDPGDPFPDTSEALDDPAGLLAAGGDLGPDTLLRAYRKGIFPWFSEGEPILWWTLSPRLILRPENFHLSRSLARSLRKGDWRFAADQQFGRVISLCAHTPRAGQPGTWITPAMQRAYLRLHELDHAHSIEVYDGTGKLVGGLYGVCSGQVFFGESMFSLRPNASKVALWLLCQLREELDIRLIDCQMETPHLKSLGAQCLSREQFEEELAALQEKPSQASWRRPMQVLPETTGGID